jgi:5-methylcytosine-specific restriction endonuclease McrA
MKKCCSCGELKPEEEFHWRAKALGIRRGYCRSCQAIKHRKWYKNNAETVKDRSRKRNERSRKAARKYAYNYLKKHPCVICGETNTAALDFHHIEPASKTRPIPHMISGGYSLDAIKAEIAKCQILCANCHRKQTAKDQNWYDWR